MRQFSSEMILVLSISYIPGMLCAMLNVLGDSLQSIGINGMAQFNCWNLLKCQQQAGEGLIGRLGICPTSKIESSDCNPAGRHAECACWATASIFCRSAILGSAAQKEHNCWNCAFFQLVDQDVTPAPTCFFATPLGRKSILKRS